MRHALRVARDEKRNYGTPVQWANRTGAPDGREEGKMAKWDYNDSIRVQIRERLNAALAGLDTDDLHGVGLDIASANSLMITLMRLDTIRRPGPPRIGSGVTITDGEVR